MSPKSSLGHHLEVIHAHSPAGFAIGLHIKFSTPKYLFQTYDRDWMELYTARGLVLGDPTVRWGFGNVGSVRWSDLLAEDSEGVMALAADHGLKYGVTVALNDGNSRSISSFARSDREFTDDEIDLLMTNISDIHNETLGTEALSPEDHATLKRMSVLFSHT